MRVAKLITNWRFIEKVNLRDAANMMDISSSSLSRIERGRIPDGETLIKLISWLVSQEESNATSANGSGSASVEQTDSVESVAGEGA